MCGPHSFSLKVTLKSSLLFLTFFSYNFFNPFHKPHSTAHQYTYLLLSFSHSFMDVLKTQRVIGKEKVKKEEDEEHEADKRKKRVLVTGSGEKRSSGVSGMRCCQAENCTVDLSDAKQYHKRHKVCELHAKAQVVIAGGIRQRFCQQCSRFHELSEFDETKRSCRMRLAGHNKRRMKNSSESNAECSSHEGTTGSSMKDIVCGLVDDKGRIQITIQENANYKQHFQIR